MGKTLTLYYAGVWTNRNDKIKNGKFAYTQDRVNQAREIYNEWQQLIEATLIPGFKTIVKSEQFLRQYVLMRKQSKFEFDVLLDQFKQIRYTHLDPRNIKDSLYDVYNYKRRNKLVYKEIRNEKDE